MKKSVNLTGGCKGKFKNKQSNNEETYQVLG